MKKIFAILLTMVMVISMFTGCDIPHTHAELDTEPDTIADNTTTVTDPVVDETEAPTEKTTVPETEAPTEPKSPETDKQSNDNKDDNKGETEAQPVHKHDYKGEVTKAATCTTDGVKTYTCSCGASYTETIKAAHNYECTSTRPATCSNTGDKTYTCKNCGNSYKETLPKNEHKWSEWVVTKEPTTTTYGQKVRTCELCHGAQQASIDPLPADETEPVHQHSYSSKVTKAATCTEEGVKTFTCSCGSSYTEAIAKTGHSWGGWVRTKEPTTEAEGQETRTCGTCGKTESRAVDKLPADDDGDDSGSDESTGNQGYYWFGNIKKPWNCASQGHHVTNKDRDGKCIQRVSCIHDEIWEYTCDVVGCGATWTENKGGAGSVAHKMSAADQAKVTRGADSYTIRCRCGNCVTASTHDEVMAKHNEHVAKNLYDGYCEFECEMTGHDHHFPSSTFNCAVCGEAIPFSDSYVVCTCD